MHFPGSPSSAVYPEMQNPIESGRFYDDSGSSKARRITRGFSWFLLLSDPKRVKAAGFDIALCGTAESPKIFKKSTAVNKAAALFCLSNFILTGS